MSPIQTTIINFTGEGLLADKKYVDDSIKNFQTENDAVIERLTNTINSKFSKGNLPAGIPDAKSFYDLVEKGYGGQLDENLLYLKDRGIKQEGFLYFDRNKSGLFRCIKTTTEDYTTNSTTYFEDASPASNHDRLTNLIETWHSEDYSQGYKKYSNGILEQWGVVIDSTSLTETIKLKVSYINKNYSVTVTNNNKELLWYTDKGMDSFIITCTSTGRFQKNWYTIGLWK